MKNIYGKIINNFEDDRPIPQPEEQLFNNPCEQDLPSELKKVKDFQKKQKGKIKKNS